MSRNKDFPKTRSLLYNGRTMKAAVLTGPGKVQVREWPMPEVINPSDVLLRVQTVGICGSDLHYFSEKVVGDTVLHYPVVLGHECAAVVEAVGSGVKRLKPGDRVAVEPAISCGVCDQCLAGRPNTCRSLSFLGHPKERTGALAEFIVMPEENCYPLAKGVSFVQATLAEPLSIGIHAVNLAESVKGKTLAILGVGPIGLSVGLAARLAGPAAIFVTDKVDDRIRMAGRELGADWAGNPVKQNVVMDVLDREPGGLDLVFECCGQQDALDQAVEMLKPGGTLMLVGIPLERRVSFDISRLRKRELRLQNVRRQNQCVGQALQMVEDGRVKPDFMATHEFHLDETQKAFETALHYRDGVIKAIIGVGP